MVALFLRGDHELNEIKAEKHAQIAAPLTFATEEQIAALGLTAGFVGPQGLVEKVSPSLLTVQLLFFLTLLQVLMQLTSMQPA